MTYLWVCWFILGAAAFWKRGDRARVRNTLFITGIFLLVCAAARACLLLLSPSVFSSLSLLQIIGAFCRGVLADAPVFALFFGPFVLFLNLPCTRLAWQKWLMGLSFFFIGIVLFILAGDVGYFRLVAHHTGAAVWDLISSFSLVCLVAWKEYKWALAAALAAAAFLTWLGVKLARTSGAARRGAWVWELVCLIFLGWTLWSAWRGFSLSASSSFSPARVYSRGLAAGHLAQNGIFSMLYALKPVWFIPHATLRSGHKTFGLLSSEEALAEAKKLLVASKQETVPDESYPLMRIRTEFNADARGKNLIILALESFDGSQVDALAGTSYGATPNLDALIRQGVWFENFYACGQSSSLEGIGTLMTGICRLGGVDYFSRGMESFSVSRLGKLFKDNGYNSFFVRAAASDWMFIGPLARLAEFQEADDKSLKRWSGKKTVTDEDALMYLARQMKQSDKPFFGFFFSLATHEPLGAFLPEELDGEVAKFPPESYLRALAYTDWIIGRFVAELKKSDLYQNTVFVIVGDHLPRGTVRDSLRDQYKIPFVISAPGVLKQGKRTEIGGQTDVLPTLVDLFHLSSPYAAMGNSLLDRSAPRFAFVSAQESDHFGLITPQGLVMDNMSLFAGEQTPSPARRKQAVGLNKAVYEWLVKGNWMREKKT